MAEYKVIRVHPTGVSPSNIELLEKYLNDGYRLVRVDQTQGESRNGNVIISNDYLLLNMNGNDTNVATIDQ